MISTEAVGAVRVEVEVEVEAAAGVASALLVALRSPELERSWAEVMGGADVAAAPALDWVREQRDQFVGLMDEVDDPLEVQRAMALHYLELRAHWTLLNTRLNFRLQRAQEPDLAQVYRASLLSLLIEVFEPFLNHVDFAAIARFLAHPFAFSLAVEA